jgi:N6-adenosine-specific RNA methylase IME4
MDFDELPRNHFGAVLADPPWHWKSWGKWRGQRGSLAPNGGRDVQNHYGIMETDDIHAMPVADLCADDAVLFIWVTWPMLPEGLATVSSWGFEYKTAFDWIKARTNQIDMFRDDADGQVGMGYWTRSNSEPCLLATRGRPKRVHADVRQGIIEPRREHSRKPDCIHGRIERLVSGPYLELFARQERPGWTAWGNETTKFNKGAA